MGDYSRYAASGEINSTVADQAGRVAAIREVYGSWFNVRASNTEPLLRLNVEAADAAAVAALRDEVLAVVRA
jgi:phosphomannomutase